MVFDVVALEYMRNTHNVDWWPTCILLISITSGGLGYIKSTVIYWNMPQMLKERKKIKNIHHNMYTIMWFNLASNLPIFRFVMDLIDKKRQFV